MEDLSYFRSFGGADSTSFTCPYFKYTQAFLLNEVLQALPGLRVVPQETFVICGERPILHQDKVKANH